MQMRKARTAEIILEYQNVIDAPPVTPKQQYAQACSNDQITVDSWRETWIKNAKANHARFGSFSSHSITELYGQNRFKPCIVAGAGPSLKHNAKDLANRSDIPLISCLHNFHFLEDLGLSPDYYVTLDAGPVVIEEVSEGGLKSAEEYWELTKDKTLLAYIGTDPKLFDLWKGKVLFFNCPLPDEAILKALDEIEKFPAWISTGGNVLGASMYIAKMMGSNPIAFVGADFAFGYDKKFHAWDSKYDKNLGYVVKMVDVFGNKVLSWQSYANFKGYFEYIAAGVPGGWINCTEGGTFGSYPDGNIRCVQQMELSSFIHSYRLYEDLKESIQPDYSGPNRILF